jgi:DNA repair exonuclease SbcCD ATPase subunit
MLKSLDYSVSFPTTGRSFQNRIEFAPGLTAITGRNEAGKTLNLEMIGYCLFGKDALRGLASDYKNLTATLHFEAKGLNVVIERAKKETLTVDGNIEAVGAQAINAAVPKLLGFGLDVFNIACAAQQGDLDALTKMRPGDRRQMVDRLIGIDVLENVEKDCRAEARTHETVASSLVVSVPVPHEPVKPDDYLPSADLELLLEEVQAHERERLSLIQIQEPVAPVAPEAPAETDVAALEALESRRQEALREAASLAGQLQGIPEQRYTRDQLTSAIAYQTYAAEVARRGPRPEHNLTDLNIWQATLEAKKQIQGEEIECPKCKHHFMSLNPELDLVAVAALATPPISEREITTQFRRHELWAEPLAEVAEFTIPNLQQEILAHARADDRADLQSRLTQLDVPADRSGDLRAARAYQQDLAVYRERADRYDRELAAYGDAQSRLEGMEDRGGRLVDLQRQLGEARSYEAALARFQHELARYQDVMARAVEKRELAEGFKRGATSLKNARVRVKQELAPDLSKAASTLLYAMTNGERRFVDVDEDFNIMVDGQPLQTLSGSGKSVVNLALRIGLGQVLTSKVLPIFLGDEIDKDMDKQRAGATHTTMQNLRQYLSQIIIVTHKEEFEADHTINLDMVLA